MRSGAEMACQKGHCPLLCSPITTGCCAAADIAAFVAASVAWLLLLTPSALLTVLAPLLEDSTMPAVLAGTLLACHLT
jgi:hydroxyethylthiazole kinase-like sugar kinase family protein